MASMAYALMCTWQHSAGMRLTETSDTVPDPGLLQVIVCDQIAESMAYPLYKDQAHVSFDLYAISRPDVK